MSGPDTNGRVLLHGYFRSSASFRVRIALNLKGVAFTQVNHHLRKNEQRSESYLGVNPQGLVPTLEMDGLKLGQSLAIIEYLEDVQPLPALLPEDAAGRARVRALANIVASDIHPIDNLRVLRYLRESMGQNEEAVQRWYNHWIAEGFAAFETLIAGAPETGTFCHGDAPGLADVCLIPQVVNSQNFKLDLSPYPTIRRIYDTAVKLPAFERAMPMNQPDAE